MKDRTAKRQLHKAIVLKNMLSYVVTHKEDLEMWQFISGIPATIDALSAEEVYEMYGTYNSKWSKSIWLFHYRVNISNQQAQVHLWSQWWPTCGWSGTYKFTINDDLSVEYDWFWWSVMS